MADNALTVQFLQWIGEHSRNYTETMEAWRTSCPRLTVWEDALSSTLHVLWRYEPHAPIQKKPSVATTWSA